MPSADSPLIVSPPGLPPSGPPPVPVDVRPSGWVGALALLLGLLGLLLATLGLRALPCLAVWVLVSVLAYPIWLALYSAFLLKRRILLASVVTPASRWRAWFWHGQLTALWLVIPALLASTLLLASATQWTPAHWGWAMVTTLLLAVAHALFLQRHWPEVHAHWAYPLFWRWLLWFGHAALLALGWFWLDFAVVGAPDLRGITVPVLLEEAYQSGVAHVSCPGVGVVVGFLAALDHGAWAMAQRWIPGLPWPEWHWMAWGIFLLQTGLAAFLMTWFLLGILAGSGLHQRGSALWLGGSTRSRSFLFALLLLALPVLMLSLKLHDLDPQALAPTATQPLAWMDPCREAPLSDPQRHALQAQWKAQQDAQWQTLDLALQAQIQTELDALYQSMETAVDAYLDWYFTLVAEYQRLLALAAGNFLDLMLQKLEEQLFVQTDFAARLQTLDAALLDSHFRVVESLSAQARELWQGHLQEHPCQVGRLLLPEGMDFERDVWRAGGAAVTGTTAGVATAALASKVVASTLAKVAAKESTQIAASLGAKILAKKGMGSLAAGLGATALCAPSGPGAIACGVTAALVTWLAVDKLAIEVDERLSREGMRTEILQVLEEEMALLRVALLERHRFLQQALRQELETSVDGWFLPARER
jgi:hypothetical protein